MRKRLLVALVFAAAGLAVAVPLGDWLGYGLVKSLIGCGAVGAFLGYVISIFLDIFLTTSNEAEN
jgi:NhaP-type Na+/H+ or K+/H+ antiporter